MVSAILRTIEREGQIVRMDERGDSQISESPKGSMKGTVVRGREGREKKWIPIN